MIRYLSKKPIFTLSLALALYLAGAVGFALFSNYRNQKRIRAEIDRRLLQAAKSVKHLLAPDFHDRALDKDSISAEEERRNRINVSEFAFETDFEYIYALVQKDGKFYFSAPTVTEEELKEREHWYFYPYEDAPPEFFQALEDMEARFVTYQDQWGEFRSAALPQVSPGGRKYLACADYDVGYLRTLYWKNFLVSFLSVIPLLFLTLPFLLVFRTMARARQKELKRFNQELEDRASELARSQVDLQKEIAERQGVEKALRNSEEQYRNLLDNIQEVIFRLDQNGEFIYASPSAQKVLGYSPEDVVGRSFAEFVHPDDLAFLVARFQEVLGGKVRASEYRIKLPDGRFNWVRSSSIQVRLDDGTLGIQGALNDIESQRKADLALKESEERLRNIFNTVQAGIVIIDAEDHVVVDANPAALKMLGRTREEVVDRVCHYFICPAEEGRCPITDLEQEVDNSEREIICSDGSTKTVLKTVAPLFLGGRKRLLESFIDVGNLKAAEAEKNRLENQLRQSQKMEAVGTLAGGIAHDFNNILSAIMGYTQLAGQDKGLTERGRQHLQNVLQASRRATDLVRQILTFSRQNEQARSPLEIGPIIKEALKLIRASLPSTIDISFSDEVAPGRLVLGDPTQVHQVVMNLCTNAAHSMRERGGKLEVRIRETPVESPAEVDHQQAGLELTVSDTGCGMPPEVAARVFEPCYSTKKPGEGTGLGLSVVHGLVISMGGEIEVESEPGRGSLFRIRLPILDHEAEAADEEAQEKIPTGEERILFVDDEEFVVASGREMLRRLGYQVTGLTSSFKALELFKSAPNQVDLVITDQTMPNLTGLDLASEMMKIRPDLPVILCTGYSERVTAENARDFGIKRFLLKPITLRDLAQSVREVLDEASRKAE